MHEAEGVPGAAAVFVTDPKGTPRDGEQILVALYGLTGAASALALALAGDAPLVRGPAAITVPARSGS